MRVAFALLTDNATHNWIRKFAMELDRQYRTGLTASRLPPHVSLKQSFVARNLAQIESYFDALADSMAPINIAFTHMGLRAFPLGANEYGVIWLEVAETPILRNLHNRICAELAARFEKTHSPTDGAGYRFHATIALGEPLSLYEKIYQDYSDLKVDWVYTAKEIAMLCSPDDSGDPGSFVTHKILRIDQHAHQNNHRNDS